MVFWEKHFKIFSMQDDTSVTARKDYAEKNGFKDNTMRTKFAKLNKLNATSKKSQESLTTSSSEVSAPSSSKKTKAIKNGKKIDYLKHCKKFLLQVDISPEARKAYALRKRFSDNTFRGHVSKYKKSEEYKKSLEQQSIIKEIKKRKNYADQEQGVINNNLYQLDNGCRTFVKGNQAGREHGKKSSTAPQIKSLINFLNNKTEKSLCDIRLELSQQLEQLKVNYSDYIQIIEKDYAEGRNIILKKLSECHVLNVEVSKSDAIAEVEYQITPEIIKLQILIKQLDNRIT
jgi:predicted double-glycine peptidase